MSTSKHYCNMTNEDIIGIQVSKQLEISLTKFSNALSTYIKTFFIEKRFRVHFIKKKIISISFHNSKQVFFASLANANWILEVKVKRVTLLVSFPRPAQTFFSLQFHFRPYPNASLDGVGTHFMKNANFTRKQFFYI